MSKCCSDINSGISFWRKLLNYLQNQKPLSARSSAMFEFICDTFWEKCNGKAIRA